MTLNIGKMSVQTLQLLIDIGEMSTAELSSITGRSRTNVNDSIRRLKWRKLVRIVRWERQPSGSRGEMIPLYGAGAGENAPKPKAKSNISRNADYRKRKRKVISLRRDSYKEVGIWRGLL